MKLSRSAALRALAGATAASVAGAPAIVRAQTPAGLTTVRVASAADDGLTPMLYALHAGMFAAAGLDVQLQRANSGAAVSSAVAAGAMDLGRGSLLPSITAYARGLHFRLVAPSVIYVHKTPDAGLIVLADSPIKTARDLDGKTVSSPGLYDVLWLSSKAWLDQNGADATVQYIETPQSLVLASLEDGRVAAGALSEPNMSIALRSGKVRYFADTLAAIGLELIESVWYTTADYVTKNADVVARFRNVIVAATAYTNAHHAETVDLLAAFTGMEPAVIAQAQRAVCGTVLDPRMIQPMIDAAAKYKVIPQSFSASLLLG